MTTPSKPAELPGGDPRRDEDRGVGGVRGGAEAGEVLRAAEDAARGEPPGEREAELRRAEVARAERPPGEVEDRREVHVDPGRVQRPAGRPPGREGLRARRVPARRGGGRKLGERPRPSSLLVDEDQRAGRAVEIPAP